MVAPLALVTLDAESVRPAVTDTPVAAVEPFVSWSIVV
jgi:hypothetical protein